MRRKTVPAARIFQNETILYPPDFGGNSNTNQTTAPSVYSLLRKPVVTPASDSEWQGLTLREFSTVQGTGTNTDSTTSTYNAAQPCDVQRMRSSGTQTERSASSTARNSARSQTIVQHQHTSPSTTATIVDEAYRRDYAPKSRDEPQVKTSINGETRKCRTLSIPDAPMQPSSSWQGPRSNMKSRRNRIDDMGFYDDVLPRKRQRLQEDEIECTGIKLRRRRARTGETVRAGKAARKTLPAEDNEECNSSKLYNSCLQGFRGVRAMSEQVVSKWRGWKDTVNAVWDGGSS